MIKQKTTTDKLNQLTRISSYLTKEQYHTQLDKIINEWESKKKLDDKFYENLNKYKDFI
tara:strand:+ start:121 stop:297 length:177 start_codon:yes stop_codon:yes gene_type:complete